MADSQLMSLLLLSYEKDIMDSSDLEKMADRMGKYESKMYTYPLECLHDEIKNLICKSILLSLFFYFLILKLNLKIFAVGSATIADQSWSKYQHKKL